MEEWRLGRDSRGRTGEAQWKLIMQGCKVNTAAAPVASSMATYSSPDVAAATLQMHRSSAE